MKQPLKRRNPAGKTHRCSALSALTVPAADSQRSISNLGQSKCPIRPVSDPL